MRETEYELRKARVINVPHYDRHRDVFIFDDGKVIDNSDPLFKEFGWR